MALRPRAAACRRGVGLTPADACRRIAVVGNGGRGKSTIARRLADARGLPVHFVDQVQWRPGWVAAPEEEVRATLDGWAARSAWVIDGWGPWPSIEGRLRRADAVVFVDLPLWMHFWLAAERQIAIARGGERVDPVPGCDDLAATRRLFETIQRVDDELLPRLRALVDGERGRLGVRLHHVRSLEELDRIR